MKDKWVEVCGLRIHYLTEGEKGSPVLLLHGGGLDSASISYRFSIDPLSKHFRIFAPDLPGYGESDKPRIEYTTDYYINFLGHFMDALDIKKADIVGISMGGAISLGFTLQSPLRVRKLVLVDSHGLGGEIPWKALSYLVIKLPFLSEMLWMSLRWSKRMIHWGLVNVIHDPQLINDELIDEVYQMMKKPRIERAFISWQRSETRWRSLKSNYVNRLSEIKVPTLILHGRDDKYVPVSWAQRAQRLIKGSELVVFPECGHWLPREKTEEFNRVVLRFLKDDN